MKRRIYSRYQGRVQGVGFRFTAQRVAGDFNISGWVKNMPDGGVELAAEGEERLLKGFLSELKSDMGRYISSDKVQWQEFTGEFAGFNIRY